MLLAQSVQRITISPGRFSVHQANLMPDERFTLIAIVLLIRILDKFFKDTVDSWDTVIQKSRKWLEDRNINLKPEIKSKPLEDFVSDYILKINVFKNLK